MKSMSFSTSLEEQAPLVERVLAVNVSGLQESSGHLCWTPDFKAKPQRESAGAKFQCFNTERSVYSASSRASFPPTEFHACFQFRTGRRLGEGFFLPVFLSPYSSSSSSS